ncbi:MAG: YiiX/YebB-like N1pC/P60 family cysteine hydrolase [Planctomycetales bacterium]
MSFPESVTSGARSVVGIADHFEQLKQVATPLFEADAASERGYFTPTEDKRVRQLLISYWQSRNALIETVVMLHQASSQRGKSLEDKLSDDDRAVAFLVAWSGALVLVDAARFLRRNCEGRPIVLNKLNEPEPHFGIPAGTYDRIQASLTSPVHAWHLYHARDYWDRMQSVLSDLVTGTEVEPLIEIAQRLYSNNNVDLQQYAVGRMRTRTSQAKTTGRDLVGRAMYGLQKTVSRLISGKFTHIGHKPQLPSEIADQVRTLIRPGDVFVNRKEHAITNYFLPGFWPHAAFYIGQTEQLQQMGIAEHPHGEPRWRRLLDCDANCNGRVVEALKDGVRIRSLASPFAADAITVIRPRLPADVVKEAITRALFHDGKPYDFDFDLTRSDRLVCTELVYRSFEGLAGVNFSLTDRAGRKTLAAEDLLNMALAGQHFEVVAAYAPGFSSGVATETAAADVLRATLAD